MRICKTEDLINMLKSCKKGSKIALSSDSEGNSFGDIAVDTKVSLGYENGTYILYPINERQAI